MITIIDKNTALVLIDLQKGIGQMPLIHPIKDILQKSALLVDAFRNAGLPVVVVNVNPVGIPQKRAEQSMPLMKEMPEGYMDIMEEIKTQPNDIYITKQTWNAFYNSVLHTELQKRGITGIVFAGIVTSRGVEGTARAASELNYNISFATDTMTDMIMEAHQNSIKTIFPRLGETGTTTDIINKINSKE